MYQGYENIIVQKQDKILLIKFSKPEKKNALNRPAYLEIGRVFREVALDDGVTIVVLTGNGDFFTAGNDLSQSMGNENFEDGLKEANRVLTELIVSIIKCPKVILALINGPAIGIGATIAALCDLIWCSNTAYFSTPFTKLGICPEAGSSYLFPLILGRSKASEMILLSEKMTAEEAYKFKFVSKIYNPNDLETIIWPKIKEFANLPANSLRVTKKLLCQYERETLLHAVKSEVDELYQRFLDSEFLNAIFEFSNRKQKAKL